MRRSVVVLMVAAVAATARAEEAPAPAPRPRTEVGIFPGVNYNTDLGLGMGAVVGVARLAPGERPYRWRLQALLYLSIKSSPDGGVEIVEHDDYIDFERPNLFDGRLRLRGRLTFHRLTNTGWYGVGNAAPDDTDEPRGNQYKLLEARGEGYARVRVAPRLELYGGLRAQASTTGLYAGSDLARDAPMLVGIEDHGELLGTAGVIWDVRDHEYVPTTGWMIEAALRGATGIGERYRYGGGTLAWRGFVGLLRGRVVFAGRIIGDLLVGDAPFYELARHGGIYNSDATGGGTSIRGVPAQRYHGKGKVLGSGELRLRLLPFRLLKQRFNAGVTFFVDAGRVFHDGDLDGDGPGLHLGLGGGVRMQWGETFIGRADLAASPEGTSGLYLGVGHIF